MSALDDVLKYGLTPTWAVEARAELSTLITECDESRAEVARLEKRVAELEQDNNVQRCMIEGLNVAIAHKDDEIENLTENTATLTPRNCETCRKAAEAMREAAANYIDDNWHLKMIDGDAIRDLPLPSFGADGCGVCEPLKSEE